MHLLPKGGHRERETDRQRQRQRDRDRQTDRQTQTDTDRQTDRGEGLIILAGWLLNGSFLTSCLR